jgi:hypothetical protein
MAGINRATTRKQRNKGTQNISSKVVIYFSSEHSLRDEVSPHLLEVKGKFLPLSGMTEPKVGARSKSREIQSNPLLFPPKMPQVCCFCH